MTNREKDRARRQAAAHLETIQAVMRRLAHIAECDDPEECGLSAQEIRAGLGLHEGAEVGDEERRGYHDEDAALEYVQEMPLSVDVRSGWQSPSAKLVPVEYQLLMSTGGPAVRITGRLDARDEPADAEIEYQDWCTEFRALPIDSVQKQDLLQFARCCFR